MRGWVVCALLLAGCQSTPPAEIAVNPTPVRVAASQAEPVEEKKLDLPPSRAHDLASPVPQRETAPQQDEAVDQSAQPTPPLGAETSADAEFAEPPAMTHLPAVPTTALQPEPAYPVASSKLTEQASAAILPPHPTPHASLESEHPLENGSSVANLHSPRPHRPVPGLPPSVRPTGYPGPAHSPLPPGAISPRPPHLPGQVTPPANPKRELEQAYRQSRADALNMKYHRGRPVYDAHSPQVDLSSAAPLPPMMPPSIPGQYGVSDAFKASEIKREQWRAYPTHPPSANPGIPGRY